MSRYQREWNPYAGLSGASTGGYGASQWTDYAPPARWAGPAVDGLGDYVQLPYAGYGLTTSQRFMGVVAVLTGLVGWGTWWVYQQTRQGKIHKWIGYPVAAFGAYQAAMLVAGAPAAAAVISTAETTTPGLIPGVPAVPGA